MGAQESGWWIQWKYGGPQASVSMMMSLFLDKLNLKCLWYVQMELSLNIALVFVDGLKLMIYTFCVSA